MAKTWRQRSSWRNSPLMPSAALMIVVCLALAPKATRDTVASHLVTPAKSTQTHVPPLERRLKLYRRQLGRLTPKSLVASPDGRVYAQNMMYQHSVAVFDADGERITDIDDRVPRTLLGKKGKGFVRGAPVEGALSADGKRLYVSNYAMFGPGFSTGARDHCKPGDFRPSYVFEIDTDSYTITRAFLVGATPKFLVVTRDGNSVLVTNWCDYSLSKINLADGHTSEVNIGVFPRGIAQSNDGRLAFVTSMSKRGIAVVDVQSMTVVNHIVAGRGPRHLLMLRDGHMLVSLSHEASIAKVDVSTGKVVARVRTGRDPRSMALSTDETALYVGNYGEDSLSVIDVGGMRLVQKIATGPRPIGVAFEPTRERVWVSCYAGSVRIYDGKNTQAHKSVRPLWAEAKRFPP